MWNQEHKAEDGLYETRAVGYKVPGLVRYIDGHKAVMNRGRRMMLLEFVCRPPGMKSDARRRVV